MRKTLLTIAVLLLLLPPWVKGFDPKGQDDTMALARHFVTPESPLGPPLEHEAYQPLDGETIVLMGGGQVFQMQDRGDLEMALQKAFPQKHLKVRNIAWPSDTVYRQQRPMYFFTDKGEPREGSVPDLRRKLDPGTFVLCFGKMESLDGLDALPTFRAAYANLLKELGRFSQRMILVGPSPFWETGPAAHLMEARNEVLYEYAEAIKELATENKFLFVDQMNLQDLESEDGVFLSETGKRWWSVYVTEVLGVPEVEEQVALRRAILSKNHLWDQYYRPTNWAFLFGDRQHVPSSRDHRDANRRWFVEELEALPAYIENADNTIWEEAGR